MFQVLLVAIGCAWSVLYCCFDKEPNEKVYSTKMSQTENRLLNVNNDVRIDIHDEDDDDVVIFSKDMIE